MRDDLKIFLNMEAILTLRRFCGVVLGPITNFKMESEPIQDMLGRLSDFRYQATRVTLQMSSLGREGVC